jgi:hypothetical protein
MGLFFFARHVGDDAMFEASERADQQLEEGDMASAETWPGS